MILFNINRGTDRLHYKFASVTLNSITWHVSVTKHADSILYSVTETYIKENLCNCYSRVTTRRSVPVNPLIGRDAVSETVTPACHYNVEFLRVTINHMTCEVLCIQRKALENEMHLERCWSFMAAGAWILVEYWLITTITPALKKERGLKEGSPFDAKWRKRGIAMEKGNK